MSVVVIASTTPQPDQAQAVREAVLPAIPQVHAEEGCERYALHEARDGSLVMIGQWAGPESLAAHGRGEPFSELSRQLEGELAAGPLQVEGPRPPRPSRAQGGALDGAGAGGPSSSCGRGPARRRRTG